jgi:hypothetical protein
MVSNEIFTALTEPKTQAGFEVPWTGALAAPLAWRIEKEASSFEAMRSSAAGIVLEYRLGTDRARSPYVALATDVHTSRMAAIEAALTADRPLRVSIQVRVRDGSRWGQSLYVDSSDRLFRVPLEALRSPVGSGGKPSAGSVVSILLVIDLTNAFPGSAGRLTLRSLRLLD